MSLFWDSSSFGSYSRNILFPTMHVGFYAERFRNTCGSAPLFELEPKSLARVLRGICLQKGGDIRPMEKIPNTFAWLHLGRKKTVTQLNIGDRLDYLADHVSQFQVQTRKIGLGRAILANPRALDRPSSYGSRRIVSKELLLRAGLNFSV